MLNLFYASGTSAMAPHILLQASGLPFTIEKVNLDQKTWANGDYNRINEKSYVPTLQTSPNTYLTECAVILEVIDSLADNQYAFNYGTDATGNLELGLTTSPPNCIRTLFLHSGRVIGCRILMNLNNWFGNELRLD